MNFPELEIPEKQLREYLQSLGSVIVAYSGGVDSSVLAYYAKMVLKQKAVIVIAKSASLAEDELLAAREQANQFGFDLLEIETNEISKPEYQINDGSRCYHCKKTLFQELADLARLREINHIAYGANMDDKQDYRPGQKAAEEFKVVSPLQTCNLSKEEIRYLAKKGGLPSWDRPQAACLASRFPTFEPVTITGLSQIEKAEVYLKSKGFRQVRVRHHNDLARIELSAEEMANLVDKKELMREISQTLKEFGYQYVSLDLEGYRQGSSNKIVNSLLTKA